MRASGVKCGTVGGSAAGVCHRTLTVIVTCLLSGIAMAQPPAVTVPRPTKPTPPRVQVEPPRRPRRAENTPAQPIIFGASDARIHQLAERAAGRVATSPQIGDVKASVDQAVGASFKKATESAVPSEAAGEVGKSALAEKAIEEKAASTEEKASARRTPLFQGTEGSHHADTGAAGGQAGDGDGVGHGGGVSSGWILNTLGALGVVIGVILLARRALSRMNGGVTVAGSSPVLQVLSRTAVAPRNHVLLIRLGERILVVGDSAAGLRTLAELTDPQEIGGILAEIAQSESTGIRRSFGQLLGRLNGEYDTAERTAVEGGDDSEHVIDRARDQLSSLLSRVRAARISEEA